jgi:uncharacterized membrane protein YbhN (UPF0104 family)
VFFGVNHLLRFVRWQLLLRAEGYRVPWWRSLSIFMAGLALLPTPAKAGVAARSVLLQAEGVPVHVSLAAYFAERLLDLIGLVLLALLLLAEALPAQRLWILGGAGAAAVVLIVAAPRLAGIARDWSASRPSALARAIEWAMRFFIDAADMIAGWRFAAFVALGMLANIATGWFLWYALGDASSAITPAAGVGILAVSHLSGSISLLPGGIGGFELAMLAQLAAVGVPHVDALRSLALVRVVTLWGSVVVGLPLLWLGMRRLMRRGAA